MSDILAIDVAILPPPVIRDRALELSAQLARRRDGVEGLVLDASHLPHVTLTQQFVRRDELDAAFERIDEVLRGQGPVPLRVTGAGAGSRSLWMTVERTPLLIELHERLMEALRGFERPGGTAAAFFDGDARMKDVLWVAGYRLKSSFGAFTPHITLGAPEPDAGTPADVIDVQPMSADAETIAACHLGRYCSCRAILRSWTLGA